VRTKIHERCRRRVSVSGLNPRILARSAQAQASEIERSAMALESIHMADAPLYEII